MLTEREKQAIDNLAAMFFEKSDDLIAVSSQLESVIKRRCDIVAKRGRKRNRLATIYFSGFDSKPELK